jgi:hypothetical protein
MLRRPKRCRQPTTSAISRRNSADVNTFLDQIRLDQIRAA